MHNEWTGEVTPIFPAEEIQRIPARVSKSPEQQIAEWLANAGKIDLLTLIVFLVANDNVAAVLAYNYTREHTTYTAHDEGTSYCTSLPEHEHREASYTIDEYGYRTETYPPV